MKTLEGNNSIGQPPLCIPLVMEPRGVGMEVDRLGSSTAASATPGNEMQRLVESDGVVHEASGIFKNFQD